MSMSRSLHPIESSEHLNDFQNVATETAASDSFNTCLDAFSSPPDATAPAATSSLFESEAQLYYDKAFRALGFSDSASAELVRRFVYYEDEWPHEEPLRCALIAIESEPVPEPLEYDAPVLEALIERYGFMTEIAHGFAERIRESGQPGHRRLRECFVKIGNAKPGHSSVPLTAPFGEPYVYRDDNVERRGLGVRFEPQPSGMSNAYYLNQLGNNLLDLLETNAALSQRISSLRTPLLLFYATSDSLGTDGNLQSSAERIWLNGIDVRCGHAAQDYSDGAPRVNREKEGGFYLSVQCASAIAFARSRDPVNPAVLVYAISRDTFDMELSPELTHLNFYDENQNPEGERYWQRVVRYYRNACRGEFCELQMRSLAAYDYIWGPRSEGEIGHPGQYSEWRDSANRVCYGSNTYTNAKMSDNGYHNNNLHQKPALC